MGIDEIQFPSEKWDDGERRTIVRQLFSVGHEVLETRCHMRFHTSLK